MAGFGIGEDWDFVRARTFAIFERKAEELWMKMLEVNQRLFASSLVVGNHLFGVQRQRVELKRDNTVKFDTWFIVQVWRDWYSHQLVAARLSCKLEGATTVDDGLRQGGKGGASIGQRLGRGVMFIVLGHRAR